VFVPQQSRIQQWYFSLSS